MILIHKVMLYILKLSFITIFSDTKDTFLELQSAATNLEPWEAFCHYTKLGMVERYQLHWLNQKGHNETVSNAFEQANKKSFKELMAFSEKFKEENLSWMFQEDFDEIATFIVSHSKSMKVAIKEKNLPDGLLQLFQIHKGIRAK